MTPQIWLDVLSKAYWSMDKVRFLSFPSFLSSIFFVLIPLSQVSLIVFDECHHAGPKKKHPYSEIMRQHYHPRKQAALSVPRILGLTASPIWNVKNPLKAISDLEALLDARIFEVSKHHQAEMEEFSPKATERLVEHPPEPAVEADEQLERFVARLSAEVVLEEQWLKRIEAARTVRPIFLPPFPSLSDVSPSCSCSVALALSLSLRNSLKNAMLLQLYSPTSSQQLPPLFPSSVLSPPQSRTSSRPSSTSLSRVARSPTIISTPSSSSSSESTHKSSLPSFLGLPNSPPGSVPPLSSDTAVEFKTERV